VNWFKKKHKVKETLGDWIDGAHANGRKRMLPVLELERFKDHLTKFDGLLEPTGPCLANA